MFSHLLLQSSSKNYPTPNLSTFVLLALHPVVMSPWHFFGDWLRGNDPTAFETAHGMNFWEFGSHNPDFFNLFNEGMASDTQALMSLVHVEAGFRGAEFTGRCWGVGQERSPGSFRRPSLD